MYLIDPFYIAVFEYLTVIALIIGLYLDGKDNRV